MTQSAFETATGDRSQVPEDWMPATATRALILEDPILVWLEFHGEANGFQKDASPYEFTEFLFEKGKQFERKWLSVYAPEAVRVCDRANEVLQAEKVRQTLDLMARGIPAIAAPALWWSPERIYGVPDLIVQGAWLRDRLPAFDSSAIPDEQYVVLDIKFSAKLGDRQQKTALQLATAQVRLYAYMLGQIAGVMPAQALLVCRDRIDNPLIVPIRSAVGAPLDADLRDLRDRYLDIKLNGSWYRPGINPQVEANLANAQDYPWHTAKRQIACDWVPGGDPCLVYQIGKAQRQALADKGFPSLQALLATDADRIPLKDCKGLGDVKCPQIRAVLRANSTGTVTPARFSYVPVPKPFEFYVDFETFSNLNVDFERDWGCLEGCPMIFMLGVVWAEAGVPQYRAFIADTESRAGERRLLQEFWEFLCEKTGDRTTDSRSTALFHWSNAEVSQMRQACDRQELDANHPLRSLPWFDLQKEVFLKEPIGVPGAFNYGLKEIACGLGLVQWLPELSGGLYASAAAWKAYQTSDPLVSEHMEIVRKYNEVDCKALYEIVRWLRRSE